MDQLYKILTCAYRKMPLPDNIVISRFVPHTGTVWFGDANPSIFRRKQDTFLMYNSITFNVVIVKLMRTIVCLVVDDQVHFWYDGIVQNTRNFIHRVEYPALANLLYICWTEKLYVKWVMRRGKPFASHRAFSPDCTIGLKSAASPAFTMDLICLLWRDPEEDNFYNGEIQLKPWHATNIWSMKRFIRQNNFCKESITRANDEYNETKDVDLLYNRLIRLGLVDLFYILLTYALEVGDDVLYNFVATKWSEEIKGKRAKQIIRALSVVE